MRILTTGDLPTLLIRLAVGLIFISEGIQKFITPAKTGTGRFLKMGFSNPEFWASFTGVFEIICGLMILLGFLTRLAVLPLLTIMIVAFFTTKIPILYNEGFWSFAHAYRTDFAMTLLLLWLLIYGGGNASADKAMTLRSRKLRPSRQASFYRTSRTTGE